MGSDLGAKFQYVVFDDHEYPGQRIIVLTIPTRYFRELSQILIQFEISHEFRAAGKQPLVVDTPRWRKRKGD
jgi:hypothetical protein